MSRNVTLNILHTLDLAVIIRANREPVNGTSVIVEMPMFTASINRLYASDLPAFTLDFVDHAAVSRKKRVSLLWAIFTFPCIFIM